MTTPRIVQAKDGIPRNISGLGPRLKCADTLYAEKMGVRRSLVRDYGGSERLMKLPDHIQRIILGVSR